jgi:predicted esterase
MDRRAVLAGFSALAASAAVRSGQAAPVLHSEELELSELNLPGHARFGRVLLAVPRELPAQVPVLVLLHGLGEAHDQSLGARAFAERYGLLSSVARLTRPPLQRTPKSPDYFGDGRLEQLNESLAAKPFPKLVIACPFTPNPYKAGAALMDRFAEFVTGQLSPAIEERVQRSFSSERRMISGVSMGGYVALEVFLRRPENFCGVGLAQGAFGANQAEKYAFALEAVQKRVGPRAVELLTSTLDPYRRPNELLRDRLTKLKVPCELRVAPGPHDQRWLRESGVIELLMGARRAFERASTRSL